MAWTNGRYFPDDNLKCIFLNNNNWLSNEILLKCILDGPIRKKPNRRQAISWTNDDQDIEHHMSSVGHNELTVLRCILLLQSTLDKLCDCAIASAVTLKYMGKIYMHHTITWHNTVPDVYIILRKYHKRNIPLIPVFYSHLFECIWHQADYINGLMQNCSNSNALTMELLLFCVKPSICDTHRVGNIAICIVTRC